MSGALLDGWLAVLLALAAGLLLGVVYFAALRRAVEGLSAGRIGGAGWLLGAALRLALFVGGFLLVTSGDWRRGLACLLGFLLARRWVVGRSHGPEGAPRAAQP